MVGCALRVWVCLVIVGAVSASPVRAQEPTNAELKKDIQALTEAVKALQQNMQELKTLLQQQRAAPAGPQQNVTLELGNRPFRGKVNAPLTLVEFSDFQCPFCARHVAQTDPELIKEYVDTGKVKVVFMDFPLEQIHPQAFKASEAARCAGEQSKFWEMHDQLFATQKTPADFSNWSAHAQKLGLDAPKFDACMGSGKHAEAIRRDLAQGRTAGITGTPAFYLAPTDPTSARVKTVRFISGAQPFANFKAQIDGLLKEQEAAAAKAP